MRNTNPDMTAIQMMQAKSNLIHLGNDLMGIANTTLYQDTKECV